MKDSVVIEVVLLRKATADKPAEILFGPKAYVNNDRQSAIMVATAEAIAVGVTVDGTTEPRTRFFG